MERTPVVEPGAELTQAEIQRYSRHLIVPNVGMEGQRRLKNAKVLCIGAGGLGSVALMYLAAAGVGTIGIVEFDVVEESNLQRQIIHGQSDIGSSKAQSAKNTMQDINPLITVNLHEERLENTNAIHLFEQYDLILDGTDNFATRYLANDAATLLQKPYIWGSIFQFEGQVSVFWAEQGPCYRCIFPDPPPPGSVPSCAEGGVLGVLCATIGSIQVTEAIKLITGVGEPLIGRIMFYDALAMAFRQVEVKKDPSCALCSSTATITELQDYATFCGINTIDQAVIDSTITVHELKRKIDAREPLLLIDVREHNEFEIVHIDGALLIPKGELLNPNVVDLIPRDKPIVLYCKSGGRSAEALVVMKAAGYDDAVHVAGGVLAWVNEIEPEKPTY